jgi:glycine oxidase
MHDCLIIGGGVIGLSLAYELARAGQQVRVVDRIQPGREASWAAAGILPPPRTTDTDPLERLAALSCRLHPDWAARLRAETTIDNGYRRCGALYLADESLIGELTTAAMQWRRGGVTIEELSADAAVRLEPTLRSAAKAGRLRAGLLVPDEVQIRSPWNMHALEAACVACGVEISVDTEVEDFEIAGDRIRAARTRHGPLVAETFCVTSGAWSGGLLGKLGVRIGIKPIRGQIMLLKMAEPILQRVVYAGPHYFVPREDGRLLVGSTLEDVGFDHRVTSDAVRELLDFAISWVPELRSAEMERCWAGLRPASADGRPYMGRVPGLENAFVAAGHYRSGLILAPATAVLMSQLIRGQQPEFDLSPFAVESRGEGRGASKMRPSSKAEFSNPSR